MAKLRISKFELYRKVYGASFWQTFVNMLYIFLVASVFVTCIVVLGMYPLYSVAALSVFTFVSIAIATGNFKIEELKSRGEWYDE